MLVNSILYYCQHLCEHNTHLDCWMGLWIQTLKPDVEQLEQDVERNSMIIFVWPQYSQDTPCILCSLMVYYSAPIIILIPIIIQLTSVKLTYPTFPHYLNIIFPSMSLSIKWSLFFRSPKSYIHISPLPFVLHALFLLLPIIWLF